MRISEDHALEKVMLEDKMKMTDWEATNEAIEEQIARESYVEWLKENERKSLSKNKKIKFTATATATTTSSNLTSNSPKWSTEEKQAKSPKLSPRLSPKLSPKACSSGLNSSYHECNYNNFVETGSFVNQFPPQMFGLNDYGDEDILRQVLAQSQQEYLDSLKRKAKDNLELSTSNKASSSGLNYYDEFREQSKTSGGSPNKKLKSSNEQCLRNEKVNEILSEIVDKKCDDNLIKHANVKEAAAEKKKNDKEIVNKELIRNEEISEKSNDKRDKLNKDNEKSND